MKALLIAVFGLPIVAIASAILCTLISIDVSSGFAALLMLIAFIFTWTLFSKFLWTFVYVRTFDSDAVRIRLFGLIPIFTVPNSEITEVVVERMNLSPSAERALLNLPCQGLVIVKYRKGFISISSPKPDEEAQRLKAHFGI